MATPLPTPYELLLARSEPGRPLVTHYGTDGGRIELSAATCANAVAKAAGLLRDELGVAPGAAVSVDLPRHWQLPVWVLAALTVGARCGRALPEVVDVRVVGPQALGPAAAGEDLRADEVLASSCDAFGMPVPGGVPVGVLDVGLAARVHPDVFAPEPAAAEAAALSVPGGQAIEQLAAEQPVAGEPASWVPWPVLLDGRARLASLAGARLWVDDALADPLLPWATAALPVLVSGSVVLTAGLAEDVAGRLRAVEGVTHEAAALVR
ncbi:MAG TPA: TIGR03089 family protein [Candidatus Nanopelagicales bacterium]